MLTMEEETRINDPLQAASRQLLTLKRLHFSSNFKTPSTRFAWNYWRCERGGSSIQSALELRAERFALKTESPVQLIQAAQRPFRARMGGDRLYSTRYDQSRDRKVIEGERQYRTLSSQKYFQ